MDRSEPSLTYRISASYSAKNAQLDLNRNNFNHDENINTKPTLEDANGRLTKQNRPRSGQDSFFVSEVGSTGSTAFGVVDGVGGWVTSGVDPADFAHSLCDYMAISATGYVEGQSKKSIRPRDLMQSGYDKVMNDNTINAGGSTACIGVAHPNGALEVANLGDSGFVHIGRGKISFTSDAQTHAFNTPFQLSKIPRRMRAQMAMFGTESAFADNPKDSKVTMHDLSHGDILVLATDGVWDNLSPQDTLEIVSRYMIDNGAWTDSGAGITVSKKLGVATEQASGRQTLQSLIARAVTKEAKRAGLNARRDGPFAREVRRYYPAEKWHGGKPDDICVVVVIAVNPLESSTAKL
ncbi:protein serine/threonine phosphatase 2C [Pseudovirgaria hyperparasitica]|uniref:Protein phosphatase n=1 Tax=Pseudovirgaria hyperparasitica TaxID=470096 RepID=A0A6A6VSV6_9PEZI|nr:protein serine/threonine phosphatase 2C [Pseudovirgaria hyperparasitica]KAF2753235.1 protein serine/threonine phosphatase 2C [Pseudovirgaria hyperparasitica]